MQPSAQAHDREVQTIEVVSQVEDSWKSGAGKPRFFPGPRFQLRVDEVADSAEHIGIAGAVDSHQRHGPPGGLRGGGGAFPFL